MKLTPDQVVARFEHLKGLRGVWETHWQDVLDYTLPNMQDVITKRTAGTKKGQLLFDNTAMTSCEMLASALHGMLSNPNTFWMELLSFDPGVNAIEDVTEYLQEFTARIHSYLNATNFQTEVHQFYLDLCTIGTAIMVIEPDDDKIFHFSTRHIGECVVAENNLGRVEEIHRCFQWDARQILQEFLPKNEDLDKMISLNKKELEDKFTDKVIQCYEKGLSDKFEIIHSVYKDDLLLDRGQPFVSQYVLKGAKDKKELRVRGFRRFPYLVSRWVKASGETYGRSPAMTALPEAKTVNQMRKALVKAAQKVVDPPTQGPDDGFIMPLKTAPGSHHYYRAGSPDRIMPIFPDINPRIGLDVIQMTQMNIRSAFFVDKLNLLTGDRMTTVEVNQRIEEQLRFLAPMLGRQRFEFLIPLVDRLVDILVDRDGGSGEFIGEVPPELMDVGLSVEYTSPIARAQIVTQGQNMVRALEASAPFIQLDPTAVDIIDATEAVKQNWKIYGAPQKALRKQEEVDEIRDARAAAQEKAMEQQDGMVQAEQANKLAPVMQG